MGVLIHLRLPRPLKVLQRLILNLRLVNIKDRASAHINEAEAIESNSWFHNSSTPVDGKGDVTTRAIKSENGP